MTKHSVRVAIIGIGNCASALVQGIYYYRNTVPEKSVPGLMHVELGGYHIHDIEVVAAFDIGDTKVGKDLSEAIYAEPNNTIRFADVPHYGVTVQRGQTLDSLGKYLDGVVTESEEEPVDVAQVLRDTKTEVVISYLPPGSQAATEWYAEQVLEAGCAFINCAPVFIASHDDWRQRFEQRGLPIIGDDIKAQVGSTITHRVLANLFRERGVRIDRTYQINLGGGPDYRGMMERERMESSRISKTNAVASQLGYDVSSDTAHVGPGDYVPWLEDRKFCYIRMEGTSFGDVPVNCELKLEVWDSPNAAGVVIDAIRLAKLGLDRKIGGALLGPCGYLMQSPPEQYTDDEAHSRLEEFIREKGATAKVRTEKRHRSARSRSDHSLKMPRAGTKPSSPSRARSGCRTHRSA